MQDNETMRDKESKVVYAGTGQAVTLTLPNLEHAARETLLNSQLYTDAKKIVRSESDEALTLAAGYTTNGWDTVSVCRVTALNARIAAEKTYPEAISQVMGEVSFDGKFNPWFIVPGGDGRNVNLKVPMKSGQYVTMGGKTIDVAGFSFNIMVKLNYFPLPEVSIKDGSYELFVKTTGEDIAIVTGLDHGGRLETLDAYVLTGLAQTWMNIPENLKQFNTLFSTVIINNMGTASEEYKWLRATTISYAYTDKGNPDSCVFGVLCMTSGRSATGLPNQLPAVALTADNNALFLLNRELFVRYQLLPSLPYIFPDSKASDYTLDDAGTTITAKKLKLESVRVGAIDYKPIVTNFDICFDSTYIKTVATIETNISPGIDISTIIITKQTLGIGVNENGEQIMTYVNVGDPVVNNSTHIAPWIIITEAILALIGAVVTGIAAKVASKLVALIVGIIVAAIIAVIAVVIHAVIETIIAGGVTAKMPSVAPMVKVAANQVKWPFCEPDAFTLTDILYSDSIILYGNLKIQSKYAIVNDRLTLIGA